MLSDIIVIEPRNQMLGLYYLKWDISFIIPNKLIKHVVANLGTLLEGTVSQILHLRLILNCMTENRKLFAFFQNLMLLRPCRHVLVE